MKNKSFELIIDGDNFYRDIVPDEYRNRGYRINLFPWESEKATVFEANNKEYFIWLELERFKIFTKRIKVKVSKDNEFILQSKEQWSYYARVNRRASRTYYYKFNRNSREYCIKNINSNKLD